MRDLNLMYGGLIGVASLGSWPLVIRRVSDLVMRLCWGVVLGRLAGRCSYWLVRISLVGLGYGSLASLFYWQLLPMYSV